jgi:hypothetical protein
MKKSGHKAALHKQETRACSCKERLSRPPEQVGLSRFLIMCGNCSGRITSGA